jgi:CBS domain-containing protein
MVRTSLPLGTFLGVEVRIHLSFPVLLALAIGLSLYLTQSPVRGIGLWLALCTAVLIREAVRAIAAAYAGLHLRGLYLLPIGGVMAFSSTDGAALQSAAKRNTRWVTLSGPLANFATGLFLIAFSLALDPHTPLFAQPWISLGHILRSNVWTEFLLGAVSLIPTAALPSRKLLRTTHAPSAAQANTRRSVKLPPFSPGMLLGIAMIIAGFVIPYVMWLSVLGVFLLLYTQVTSAHARAGTDDSSILVEEVMLTEYTLISNSETLRGALDLTLHSLHETFPVVRGNRLVGAIARHTIAERLATDGDGYLQGAMQRGLPMAAPGDKLMDALRRASTLGSPDFIPVVEGDHLVGVITPQSLPRAVNQIKLLRPQPNIEQNS